ncbi:hypothetical protein AGABI1DRAFT_108290 [Agaricus bisporus var. burnettii JB137-S8]|uniref:Nephrocystin 3-like N-terminal domain-containing protein n=1 Tax=Agaricus bisporus var. burnettii (strain JB137-S8 / ATCC MYA-4627 / FGSC 10392) TaxID=597362 RepID=K5X2M5_AGABU|nr:uncharacterized protein AGABI1DRAFT_108290 [Agaricus bisporus var. burnettii JB137-S8]EKM77147.1 hypothetical protein AGABI1DRAFT_108290 [Agaricus bisporus var. burnettii JB137-S8]
MAVIRTLSDYTSKSANLKHDYHNRVPNDERQKTAKRRSGPWLRGRSRKIKKRDKLMEWLRGLFPPMKTGPQHYTGPGGFFNNAEGFILNDPIMTSVHVDNTTVINMQGAVTQIMDLLSRHIIRGAAHDSSARTPPPRCHPDTRLKLIARITAWFEGRVSLKLLLWITGPAGVGKSAVVQTFAEYLNKSGLLGASIFISRPNKRNNPHGVFITIAYQLATRIEAYRDYVVEKISRDPESLSGNMQTQFTTFIIEPFVEKKIGVGGKRWELWSKCSGRGIALSSIKSTWRQYRSTLDDKSPSRIITRFHQILFNYMTCQLCLLTCRTLQNPVESLIYSQLRKVHMRKLCHVFVSVDLLAFVNHLMPNRAEAPPIGSLVFHSHNLRSNDIEVLREVRLKDLKFGQLDWKEMSPAFAASGHRFAVKYDWMLRRPRSNAELKAFVSDLEALQKRLPELGVV